MVMKIEKTESTTAISIVNRVARNLGECMELYGKADRKNEDHCNAFWDNFYCWPSTPAGDIIIRSCTEIFPFLNNPITELKEDSYAYRICGPSGEWIWGNWTNYTECLSLVRRETPPIPLVVSHILLICSSISVLFLLTALFIFFYFRSLQCTRLRVHRNLVGSLIAHSLLLMLISLPVINSPKIPSYRNIEWLCKTVLALKMYTSMASINWMFLEGLLLHSRITTSIFRQDAPFKIYYFVGWGIPLMLILGWTFAMETTLLTPCWETYGHSVFIWIVTAPMITALTVNFFFLVNIIRILVTKLKTSLALEITQVRKAIKATALLFPLLGITHLLFCVNPQDDGSLQDAYMITNAVLQSSQGIFVTILYCFLNSDVQMALRKAYLRHALRRNPNRRYTWVRKGPGSQYSSASITHCDASTANATSSPGQKSLILLKNGRSNNSYNSSGAEVKLCNEGDWKESKYEQDNL